MKAIWRWRPKSPGEIAEYIESLLEIWRYRRVWRKMVDCWEAECTRNGGVVLEPGESVSLRVNIQEADDGAS